MIKWKYGDAGEYYEAVFADLISQGSLRLAILCAAPNKWAEIDTWKTSKQPKKFSRQRLWILERLQVNAVAAATGNQRVLDAG